MEHSHHGAQLCRQNKAHGVSPQIAPLAFLLSKLEGGAGVGCHLIGTQPRSFVFGIVPLTRRKGIEEERPSS